MAEITHHLSNQDSPDDGVFVVEIFSSTGVLKSRDVASNKIRPPTTRVNDDGSSVTIYEFPDNITCYQGETLRFGSKPSHDFVPAPLEMPYIPLVNRDWSPQPSMTIKGIFTKKDPTIE